MQRIAPNVYVETAWPGINIGAVITSVGIILIDTPLLPNEARRWQENLSTVTDLPIIYVINTDFHPDRVVGNSWVSAPVIAHEGVWEKARTYSDGLRQQLIDSLSTHHPHAVRKIVTWKVTLPQLTFTEQLILHKGEQTIELIHFDSATPASSLVYLPEEGIVFTGDIVVCGMHPLASQANSKEWLNALNAIRKMQIDRLVPGRGPIGDKQDTYAISEYIRQLRARVRKLYSAGRSKAEVSTLVSEFMEYFPVPDDQRDAIRARVKAGIDRVYEELKSGKRPK